MTGRATRTIGIAGVTMVALFVMTPTPAWATPPGPNGKIVFQCPATPDPSGGTTSAICVINPDGTGRARILDGNGTQPVWSPDGTKIAFVSSRTSTTVSLGESASDIWVMNADGSNPVQLTHSSSDSRPAWGADGRIVFSSFRDHVDDRSFRTSLYVMNADGSNQHAVTAVGTDTYDDYAAWSPDATRIAFVRFGFTGAGDSAGIDGGSQEVYTINDDGSSLRQLTFASDFGETSGVAKLKPSWSPDGTRVAFTETPFDTELAGDIVGVVNADGTNEHFLTFNSDVLTNGPNVDVMNVAWAPDGSTLVAECSYGAPTTTPGAHLCFIDPGTGVISPPIDTDNRFAVDPDWGRAVAASTDVVVTNCDDPALTRLTTVAGSFVVDAVSSCTAIDAPNLTSIGSDMIITVGVATEINLESVNSVGGNIDFISTGTADINLGTVGGVGGDIDVIGSNSTNLNFGGVEAIGGNLDMSDNTVLPTLALPSLIHVGGNVTFDHNPSLTSLLLPNLETVGGSLTVTNDPRLQSLLLPHLESVSGNVTLSGLLPTLELGSTVGGNETIVGNGTNVVSGRTATGATDVSMLGGIAGMHVVIPSGAFDQPVTFSIVREAAAPPESAPGPDGSLAQIVPLAPYAFSFAVPTLNADAQLAFRIDLSQLDDDTRAAVLAGALDGTTTVAVKGDAAGSSYQAFPSCTGADTPQTNGCVVVTLVDANGNTVTDPAQGAFVNLAAVAGHFSTWSVVLVKPLPDTTPPTVAIALAAPNGGVPNGQNGWFITGPVTGTVQATKTTGRSAITSLSCGTATLTLAGIDTRSAGGTFSIATDGVTHLVCTASDAAGNISAPAVIDVKLDRTPPTLGPTVTPSPVTLNGAATVAANASDTVSGLAGVSCASVDTSTAGPHTLTCTAADNAGNAATAAAAYTVAAPVGVCLGEPAHQVLAPIAANGSSVFVRGLPIPVRFRACDTTGRSISTNVVSSFRLVETIAGGSAQAVNLTVRSAVPGVGFFWDPLLREWDFLLATDVLKAGTTYVYDITLTDGSHIGFRFTLVNDDRSGSRR